MLWAKQQSHGEGNVNLCCTLSQVKWMPTVGRTHPAPECCRQGEEVCSEVDSTRALPHSSNQGFPISRDENASDVGVKIVELWIAKMGLGRRSDDLDARSYISACGNCESRRTSSWGLVRCLPSDLRRSKVTADGAARAKHAGFLGTGATLLIPLLNALSNALHKSL